MRPRRPARSASRNSPTSSNVAAELIRRYGRAPETSSYIAPPTPPRESDLDAFGPLVWLEVRTFTGKVEFWDFAPEPNDVTNADRKWMPRVAYDINNKQLWSIGGSYRVDGNGFHRTRKGPCAEFVHSTCDIKRAKSTHSRAFRDYVEHHGGLEPQECAEGVLVMPKRVVCVGRCLAAAYETDRNNEKGLTNWRHEMAENKPVEVRFKSMPFIDVCDTGCRFFWRGGTMRTSDGWMVD